VEEYDEDDGMEQHEVHTQVHLDEDLCRVYPCCSLVQLGLLALHVVLHTADGLN